VNPISAENRIYETFVFLGKLYGAFLYCIHGKRGIIVKVEG
jgi:hypothetical protein